MVLNCRVQLHTTLLLLLCRLAIYSHAAAHRSPEMPEGKNSEKWPLLRCFYKMVRGAATSLGSWTVSLLLALKKGESSQFVIFFFHTASENPVFENLAEGDYFFSLR